MEASQQERDSGIALLGGLPWGTHFCQFYNSGDDLIEILAAYFQAGLKNNEYCMWVTSPVLSVSQASNAMAAAIPDFGRYQTAGQIEIIPHTEWYLKDGYFDADRVLAGWVSRLEAAKDRGFDGLRLTGDTFWLEESGWQEFVDYEATIDRVIGDFRIIALCTYSLERCGVPEIMDVVKNHEFAIAMSRGEWQVVSKPAAGAPS